ncbi:ABC transporter permease [Curvivirga sp.]|uniref:ABC transporter permease n=1 Tax=Curvivirga sp. TaxID=2856848 RepID=UPI003B594555
MTEETQRGASARPVFKEDEHLPFWKRWMDTDIWHSYKKSPVIIIASIAFITLILSAIFAPLISPYTPFDPGSLNLMNGFTEPMSKNDFTGDYFFLGTDDQGRDVFSTILFGLRISLFVGLAAVLFAMTLGVILGLISGYLGGWVDGVIMRIADIQMTFPSIMVAMLLYGVGKGLTPPDLRDEMALVVLIISIGLSEWVQFARTVRGATLVEREKEYVQAGHLIGLSKWAIMLRHILPNVTGPILVIATISLALAIIAEATLSFLGVGAPKTEPSLGTLINVGRQFILSGEWWILLFPSVTLLALALSVNLFGDWLRDVLNPKLR